MQSLTRDCSAFVLLAVVVGTIIVHGEPFPVTTESLRHKADDLEGHLECPKNFILYQDWCYSYSTRAVKRTFYQAEKACGLLHSFLVSIHSASEQDFVVRLADQNSSFWIGLNDADGPAEHHTEGVFKWTDGAVYTEDSSYCSWKDGEPLNRRHLDCIKCDIDGWSVAVGGCGTTKLPYVCKKNACSKGLVWNGNACVHSEARAVHEMSFFTVLVHPLTTVLVALCLFVAMVSFMVIRTNKTHAVSSKFMLPT